MSSSLDITEIVSRNASKHSLVSPRRPSFRLIRRRVAKDLGNYADANLEYTLGLFKPGWTRRKPRFTRHTVVTKVQQRGDTPTTLVDVHRDLLEGGTRGSWLGPVRHRLWQTHTAEPLTQPVRVRVTSYKRDT